MKLRLGSRALRLGLVALASFSMMAPAAFAAGGPHDGYRRGYANTHRAPVHRTAYRDYRGAAPVHYRQPARHGYSSGYYSGGYYTNGTYGYYAPRHRHMRTGEVLGALVAGAIITNVIADAVAPRTTVVERRIVSGPYYRDDGYYAPPTRYVRSDGGYYDR